ncbi:hypothetical protein AM10699_29010 [Acaryochloris marina MBIC10699]|nr:hypothetical protein AM10699_29010 [Acaryochloris marina MBIC10699]
MNRKAGNDDMVNVTYNPSGKWVLAYATMINKASKQILFILETQSNLALALSLFPTFFVGTNLRMPRQKQKPRRLAYSAWSSGCG